MDFIVNNKSENFIFFFSLSQIELKLVEKSPETENKCTFYVDLNRFSFGFYREMACIWISKMTSDDVATAA